jgi:hypothetical protein
MNLLNKLFSGGFPNIFYNNHTTNKGYMKWMELYKTKNFFAGFPEHFQQQSFNQ